MGIFRFRHFSVENTDSAMKVNTDGVLLGALMTVRMSDRKCLDVGTGTGTIALMAAQRISSLCGDMAAGVSEADVPESVVYAIDIDAPSAVEASRNFEASPWPGMLRALHVSLDDFSLLPQCGEFDHIFSNPPYFESSLKAPDARRRAARHADTLSYRDIVAFSSRWLAPCGRLAMILPADIEMEAKRYAVSWDLYPFRMTRVRSTTRRPVSRIVMEFARSGASLSIFGGVRGTAVDRFAAGPGCPPAESVLTIMDKGGYSSEYRSLVSDFLLV